MTFILGKRRLLVRSFPAPAGGVHRCACARPRGHGGAQSPGDPTLRSASATTSPAVRPRSRSSATSAADRERHAGLHLRAEERGRHANLTGVVGADPQIDREPADEFTPVRTSGARLPDQRRADHGPRRRARRHRRRSRHRPGRHGALRPDRARRPGRPEERRARPARLQHRRRRLLRLRRHAVHGRLLRARSSSTRTA